LRSREIIEPFVENAALTCPTGNPNFDYDSGIVRFSCPAHNEFAASRLKGGTQANSLNFHDRSLSRGQKLSQRAAEERGYKILSRQDLGFGDAGALCSKFAECYSFSVFTASITFFSLLVVLAGLLQGSPRAGAHAPDNKSTVAQQHAEQDAEGGLVTIIQSGSTNTLPYKVVVRDDGSATAEIGGTSSPRLQQFPPGTIETKALLRLLARIADVSKIPTGNCPKSVSFGTRTEISYAGKTSGDLQCIRKDASGRDQVDLPAGEELAGFVRMTLRQLNINAVRLRFR
jgi:hypothetical protein